MSLSLTMHACSSDSQKAFIESVYRSTGKKKENYESISQRSQFFYNKRIQKRCDRRDQNDVRSECISSYLSTQLL